MQTGKWFLEAFRTYIDNPVIILPYLLLGIMSTGTSFFTKTYLDVRLSNLDIDSLQAAFMAGDITLPLIDTLLKYALIFSVCFVVLTFVSSFIAAYAIELTRSIAASGHSDVRSGFFALRKGLPIFVKKIFVALITLVGAAILIVPATIFFGMIGAILALVIVLVYSVIIHVVSFFAEQAIVLSGKGAWEGIVQSYRFVKNTLESSVILMLLMLFFYAVFALFSRIFYSVGSTFITSGAALDILSAGINLLLFSIVVAPLFIIIKTIYFMKK